jgi:putative DNA methylase
MSTMPYRKKLIEVALPLKAINEASAREKSIRHGHPSTLHLWWARRPLAACRAVLFASLVDDPDSDPAFQKPDGKPDEERAGTKRANLFNLIEELVQWENSNSQSVLHSARTEIARCVASRLIETGNLKPDAVIVEKVKAKDFVAKGHCRPVSLGLDEKAGRVRFSFDTNGLPPIEAVNTFLAKYAPPVLDPFCGGGSIPLEAQRLGMRAYGSDLNPVPVLITKALIEIPPKFAGRPPVNPEWQAKTDAQKAMTQWQGAGGLAEDVRYYGQWMRDEAEKRIGHLYPKVKITAEMAKDRPDLKGYVGQELTVIAWLWARTVASSNPACEGAHVPLVRSYWLSTKKGKEAYVEPVIDRKANSYRFVVRTAKPKDDFDPKKGTVVRTGATCLLTDSPISFDHIRAEGKAGRMEAKLMAIVAEGSRERLYLSPNQEQAETAQTGIPKSIPDTDIPTLALGFRVQLYGMDKHYKLFTPRQLVALTTFSDLVQEARVKALADAERGGFPSDTRPLADGGTGSHAYADALATYLAFGVDKNSLTNCTLATWQTNPDRLTQALSRQALPMTWDYAEANPLSEAGGGYALTAISVGEVLDKFIGYDAPEGHAEQLDAMADRSAAYRQLISTDPPYYDNIGYADLSDWFYVWLRRSLKSVYPSLFATALTPKKQELIASPHRHDESKEQARQFFETGLGKAFSRMLEVHPADYPLTVYYAFKQSETEDDADEESSESQQTASTGWETMLGGLVRSGFSITGTWPMRTELIGNLKKNVSALASSIVLVCRPRPANSSIATRKQFMAALRVELPEALRNLQHGNIAPVDMAQSAIGPGMGVFSRYAKVIESDGSPMTVRTALGIINQVLDEVLAEQEGEFDADTRWALAWFEQFGMKEEAFGIAETLSKAKNTAVNGLVEAGIVKAKSGKVQLLSRAELPEDWNPATDKRLTVWETTQHLIRLLETKGETEAADLLSRLGGLGETARDLAYRLYSICERKKWADEALAYNSLVIAWPELTKLALSGKTRQSSTTPNLFE